MLGLGSGLGLGLGLGSFRVRVRVRVRVRIRLRLRPRLRPGGGVVGSVHVATPGSVHVHFSRRVRLLFGLGQG